MTTALARAPGAALDLNTASREDLVSLVQDLRAANIARLGDGEVFVRRDAAGQLQRAFRAAVPLSMRQGHIFSADRGATDRDGNPASDAADACTWSLMGAGFDALNRVAGVTVVSAREPVVEYRGENPHRMHIDRVAVGINETGTLKVATVSVSIDAHHYRLQMMRKRAQLWRDRRPAEGEYRDGFAFGPRPTDMRPSQAFVLVEKLVDVEIGWTLDFAVPAVRAAIEDGNEFYKSFARRATSIADRLASARWWGFGKLRREWVTVEGADVIARVPVYGWRSDVSRAEIEAVRSAVAQGADVGEAFRSAGGPARPVERVVVGAERVENPADDGDEGDVEDGDAPNTVDVAPAFVEPAAPAVPADAPPAAPAPAPTALPTAESLKSRLREYARQIIGAADGDPGAFDAFLASTEVRPLGLTSSAKLRACADVAVLERLCNLCADRLGEPPTGGA